MKNDYYVYEHVRPDNNTCFYVGKGRGKRCYQASRNEHHDRIVSKVGMIVNIVKDNLTEKEAYVYERELIIHYVFDLGYGIDIIGYNNNLNENGHLTNHTFGGDGSFGLVHSDEWKLQHSKDMSGENNPMYGVNLWDTYSDDKKIQIKEKLSLLNTGEKNPMYGISPKERMDDVTYKNWLETNRIRLKAQVGKNNPNYGNDTLRKKLNDNPELRLQYYPRKGKTNGRAKEIFVYDKDMNFIGRFDYIGECCEWIREYFLIDSKVNSIRGSITQSIKTNKPYRNMYFSYTKI